MWDLCITIIALFTEITPIKFFLYDNSFKHVTTKTQIILIILKHKLY